MSEQKETLVKFSFYKGFDVREKIRTPDLLVRSQTLYPAELRPHMKLNSTCNKCSMPLTGIEPVREYKSRRILSPVRLPVPPPRLIAMAKAENGVRTRDPHLGKVVLYH